jgi:hypothetical protein
VGCPSEAPPVPEEKTSLYEQIQDQIGDSQTDAGTDENSQDTGSSDGGNSNPPPAGESDAGMSTTPPTAPTDAGIEEEVLVPVGDGGVSNPVMNSDLPGCRIGDVWLIDIHSVPPAGEGCQNGGGPSQGDMTQQLKVVARAGGGLNLQLLVPSTASSDYHIIHGDFFEEGLSCRMIAHVETGFNFPNDVNHDNQTTQIWMAYDYNVLATEGVINGEGLMTNGFLAFPDATNLDQATAVDINERCSEPLEMSGSVLAQ